MKLVPRILSVACLSVLSGSMEGAEPVGHGKEAKASEATQSAQNAIKSFKFDSGLKVELFAAEPLLANPVAFSEDGQGRWYIAESYRQEKGVEDNRGHANWLDADIAARTIEDRLAMIHKFYPEADKFAEKFTKFEERIVRLEDSNGDGVADQQSIYADGFRDPLDGTGAGILARGKDVWWTCIPNLWHFRDADGDGKAEVKDKLLTGFGVKFAFRGHDMHGLRFGPDGKLYFSIGDRGINVKTKEGQQVVEADTGSIMRCNPDGSGFEVFATGVRNPQELAFDEFGNLFTGDNNSDSGDKARFVNLVEGGDCGWRMSYQYLNDRGPWNREMLWDEKEGPKAKYLIPPIANISNGPSGLTYNPGTGLGDNYRNRFFLSDFRGGAGASVVHQIGLEAAGAWFKVKEQRPFLKGVLTTDCEFGNDGGFYVLDWVESWGGVGKGRIYKLTDPSANRDLQKQTQQLIKEGFDQRGEAELLQLLSHPDMRIRQGAQFALADKGAGSAGALNKIAHDSKAGILARIHAIWGLGQIAEKKSGSANSLVGLLGDEEGEVRAQAAKVLGEAKVKEAGEKLVGLLKDSAPRARFFAALSLAKLGQSSAVDGLFQMLADNNDLDPILRHGAVMGLVGCAKAPQLAAKAGDGSVAVRIGALLALRRQQSPEIAVFLKDSDEGVLLETARAIYDVPIAGALPALAQLSANPKLKNPRILERVLNAHYRLGKTENAQALAEFAKLGSEPAAARKEALDALSKWAARSERDRLLNLWRPLTDRPPTDAVSAISVAVPQLLQDGVVQEVTARLCAKLKISAGPALVGLVADEKAGAPARVAALQALATLKDDHLAEAAKVAFVAKDAKLRSEGLQVLANLEPATAVKFIGEVIRDGAVIEKQGALVALGQIKRPEAVALIGTLIESLTAGKAAPEIQLEILEAAKRHPELKDKVAQYEAGLAADPLAAYKIALAGGNLDRGRKIFREKAEVQCLRCHKCEIGDSAVGPELSKIGASKDRIYLLESIVLPNKVIAQGFGIVSLTLKDGQSVAGRLAAEEAGVLKIETLDAAGKPQMLSVPADSIKERISAPSPMPENTRDNLSKSELRDLIEYLGTRK